MGARDPAMHLRASRVPGAANASTARRSTAGSGRARLALWASGRRGPGSDLGLPRWQAPLTPGSRPRRACEALFAPDARIEPSDSDQAGYFNRPAAKVVNLERP